MSLPYRRVALVATIVLTAASTASAASWRLVAMPVSATAVSCASASACEAVGSDNGSAVAELWDGTRWRVQPTPSPSRYASLSSVACKSARSCVAVGAYTRSLDGPSSTLAEHWNGAAWLITPTPNVVNSPVLTGVSCVSASDCLAVGYQTVTSGANVPLGERWDGSSWTLTPPALPLPRIGDYDALFTGVSCVSSTACFAAGRAAVSGLGEGIIERWNGTSWQTPDSTSPLNAVSCAPTFCDAAGGQIDANNGDQLMPWAMGLNPSGWQPQTVPSAFDGIYDGELYGISCLSATNCTAVGDNTDGYPLTETYNGLGWTIQPTPTPAGTTLLGQSILYDVSCVERMCMAVGSYENARFQYLPLAEQS